MAAPLKSNVDLGFVEKTDQWRLKSHYFPSKVGGKPAWLSWKGLPKFERLSCEICGQICTFLLQVYSPLSEDRCDGFHRTLFLFVCPNVSCHKHNSNKPFKVLRSQIGRKNEFYDYEPPNEEEEVDFDLSKLNLDIIIRLCDVCGTDAGKKRCAKCHLAQYCCKEHQLLDWRAGHKQRCGKEGNRETSYRSSLVVFPEYDLVTEPEPDLPINSEGSKSAGEHYSSAVGGTEDFDVTTLEEMAIKETKDDKQFLEFQDRVKIEPEQVLRYDKGGEPLWVCRTNQPNPEDIPQCICGAPRQFEFQVMPQLLNHLNVDKLGESIDWGTLAVYTCTQSCNEGPEYHEEFLWKQDHVTSDTSLEVPNCSN